MNKNINNHLEKNTIKRSLALNQNIALETEFDLMNNIPEIQKNIKLKKLIFNEDKNLPLIIGNFKQASHSKKSIFNNKTEINNKSKLEKLYMKGSESERKIPLKINKILPLSNDSTKIQIGEQNNNKQFDIVSPIRSKKLQLDDIDTNQRKVAKSTNSIFAKNNIFLTEDEKINKNNVENSKKIKFKKTKTNIENNYNYNYNKNHDLKINSEIIPYAYSKKYENIIFHHFRQINDYEFQKQLHLNPPEKINYNFVSKNKLLTKNNILLKLLKSEQNKIHLNYNLYSKKVSNNKKKLEKDEINFEELKEKQKNVCKKFENLYTDISHKNHDLIKLQMANNYIIKENQDEIRRILHKIDKLRVYGHFVNQVLGGDTSRFEQKIIPEDKYDDEINYAKLSHEVINKYNFCLLYSEFDDGNIKYNKEIMEQEKTFIYEPEKMWFKFKEIENIIVRNVFDKEDIKNEIKKMIEEKNYNLKDLKQRKEMLEYEYEKNKEAYEYEMSKFNEIEKSYNNDKNELDDIIKDLYKYTSTLFNSKNSSHIELFDILDITKEIYKIIENSETYIDSLALGLKKFQKEDPNLFEKILENRKKYLKYLKSETILNEKMKEKFSFIFDYGSSYKIVLKSRKTEAPYHKPKKKEKIEIDKALIERLENEEMLTYEKEDDEA